MEVLPEKSLYEFLRLLKSEKYNLSQKIDGFDYIFSSVTDSLICDFFPNVSYRHFKIIKVNENLTTYISFSLI